ncbi:MAG: hypothetical protein ACLUD4_09385 [Thomasclavelia spiroformis]
MNKIIFTISTILIFSIVPISARENISSNVKNIQYTQNLIQKKDVLVWKYKSINGKMYKRLYNKTTGKWVGDWIRV